MLQDVFKDPDPSGGVGGVVAPSLIPETGVATLVDEIVDQASEFLRRGIWRLAAHPCQ
jgi:hypothetical protein